MSYATQADGTELLENEPALRTSALIRKVWPWVFLILMVVFFTISVQAMNAWYNFLSPRSIQGILIFTTQILLHGSGRNHCIIIAAGIDLSVGFILGFSAVVAAMIMKTLICSWVYLLGTIVFRIGMARW